MKLRQYLFSRLLSRASAIHEPLVASRKRRLLSSVAGRILEIGPGAGQNFAYFPRGIAWTGYEPNSFLAKQIALPAGSTLHRKPFRNETPNTFDFAVSTLVLCSVPDLEATLQALWQCLRPGGVLVFLEHVMAAPDSPLARAQARWQPLWTLCGDGCHPNRDTLSAIRKTGFRVEDCEAFSLPLWLASPHICGRAIKP